MATSQFAGEHGGVVSDPRTFTISSAKLPTKLCNVYPVGFCNCTLLFTDCTRSSSAMRGLSGAASETFVFARRWEESGYLMARKCQQSFLLSLSNSPERETPKQQFRPDSVLPHPCPDILHFDVPSAFPGHTSLHPTDAPNRRRPPMPSGSE